MFYEFRISRLIVSLFFWIGVVGCPIYVDAHEVFSIDRPSGSPFGPGDVLIPAPTIAIADSAIAMSAALEDVEIDGISSGTDDGTELLFSVDLLSSGVAGTDVSLEDMGGAFGPNDHPADIYRNPITEPGANILYRDGNGVDNPLEAPDPELGLREPFSAVMDNTDAYDAGPIGLPNYTGPIYFSVGAAAPGPFSTDSIFLVPIRGGPVLLYVGGLSMSLASDDDIDALFVLDDGDLAFGGSDFIGFSLSRTSPSLEAGSPLSLRFAGGAALSAADVFILTGTGGAFLVPASSHGLLFDDNIDALDQVPEIGDEFVLGDINGDGVVNLLDVAPFVELISTNTFLPEADINGDGEVNLLDVEPFIELLSG